MAILGNFFLLLSAIAFVILQSPSFRKPMPGGDAGVGYAWGIIIFNLAFFICMVIVSLCIAAKGGFEWVSPRKSSRILIVAIAVISTLITSVLASFFSHEGWPAPALLKVMGTWVPIVIPVVLIIASAILLNMPLRNSVPVAVYKWPLLIVSVIGVIGVASGLVSWMARSVRNNVAAVAQHKQSMDSNHQRMLQEIDTCDVMKNIVFLFVFTDGNQDADVRQKAVEKVKTHPQWQQEIIRLLQTDWAPEPMQFLASNDVDDPALFAEPVRIGILTQARLIRESIKGATHSSHFYPGLFSWEVERALRVADRFKNYGVDYVPAIRELRAALDESSEFEKPKFTCIGMLDKWLKKNE